MSSNINFILNGQQVRWQGDASAKLLDVLRDSLVSTEVKCGCREGECGACSVLLDGVLVNSCLVAVGRVQDCEVITVAGLRKTQRFAILDAAFAKHSAVQCGYCIPGMIMAAEALLSRNPHPTKAEVREAISGNLCRCTGYNAIVAAILEAAQRMQEDNSAVFVEKDGPKARQSHPGTQQSRSPAPSPAPASSGVFQASSTDIRSPAPASAPAPSSALALSEALDRLAQNPGLIPYAGGSDLMASEYGSPVPKDGELLFLDQLPELKRIALDGDTLRIGAALTYSELLASQLTPDILRAAVANIAAPAVRNVGTIGGNIANASPKGDAALVCFATDSVLRLASSRGERLVPIQDFYIGRGQTLLKPGELLVEILMPMKWLARAGDKTGGKTELNVPFSPYLSTGEPQQDKESPPVSPPAVLASSVSPSALPQESPLAVSYAFEKVGGRKALAISRVSFAGLLATRGGIVQHLACAFGAVEDVVVRHPKIDALLVGLSLSAAQARIPEWLAAYDEAIQPIRGRVSAEYRKQVCLNLARNFLETQLA